MKNKYTFILLMLLSSAFAHESDAIFNSQTVSEIRITVDPAVLNWVYSNVESDSLHPVSVAFSNENTQVTLDSVGFRIRGNTSRNNEKKSFKLDFNEFIKGQTVCGIQKFNLKAENNDPTLMRSKFALDLFRRIGMAAARAVYTEVYINDAYYGLYVNIEHIDDRFLKYHIPDNAGGNLWKCLYPADLTYRGSSPSDYYPYFDAERPYELKTNEEDYDYSKLARLIDILNNTPSAVLKDSIESVLRVTDVIKYFAVNIMTGSWDDYRYLKNNYYLYHNPSTDKFHFIPYDYDNTFGIDWVEGGNWGEPNWTRIDMYDYPAIDNSGRPLADLVFDDPEYRNLFTHFMDFYTRNVFQESAWQIIGDSLKALIRPYVAVDTYYPRDFGYNMSDFDDAYDTDYRRGHVERGLYEFMRKRSQQTLSDLNWQTSAPALYRHDVSLLSADSLQADISVFDPNGMGSVLLTFYDEARTALTENAFTAAPDALSPLVEDADRWTLTAMIPGNAVAYRLSASDAGGAMRYYPRHGYETFRAGSDNLLFINELMASNDAVIADPAGEFDDWIELYNASENDMDLSGFALSDKADDLSKWLFPSGTVLAAGRHLLIWCDEDDGQNGLHSNFKLSAGGESIFLTHSDGQTILDHISFGTQTTDISYGRSIDGQTEWTYFSVPTPGSSNSGSAVVSDMLPDSPSLAPAYPNPFNPATTLEFFLPETDDVDLSIYDVNGKHISTLLRTVCSTGSHRITFRPSDLGSGVYLCILRNSQGIVGSEKIIYIK